MTTGVFKREIYMTPPNSAGPKIGGRCKQRAIFSYTALKSPLAVMQNFATFKWLL